MGSGTENLWRTALLLEYFTIAYNIAEAVLSILAGMLAGSIALVGFGLDSVVESLSAIILVWRLRRHGTVSHDAADTGGCSRDPACHYSGGHVRDCTHEFPARILQPYFMSRVSCSRLCRRRESVLHMPILPGAYTIVTGYRPRGDR
jgi:hypothetical protein